MKHQKKLWKVKVIYNKWKNVSKCVFKTLVEIIYLVDIAAEPQIIISGSPLVKALPDLNESSLQENNATCKNSQLQLLIDDSTENWTGKF